MEVTLTNPVDSESGALLDPIFACQGLVSPQSGAEWHSLDQRGVVKGCLVFSVAMTRFLEQEVGGKKWI